MFSGHMKLLFQRNSVINEAYRIKIVLTHLR
ncbi:hypothetical protein CDAR_377181, partial [Caerostris darwini]